MHRVITALFLIGLTLGGSDWAFAEKERPNQIKDVGIVENLGKQVDLGLKFKNEKGEDVRLGDFVFKKKPVILNLVYYNCPSLCNFILNGLLKSLRSLDWVAGNQFEIVTVSIDPREGPDLAIAKKQNYLKNYGRVGAEKGWHFLTGQEDQIRQLSQQVGFQFKYDEKQKEFAHSAAIFILTDTGIISRYLYGIEYKKRDLRLALLEASEGKIGNVVDRLLLYCYRYDPNSRGYALFAVNLMKAGGAGTVFAIAGYMMVFWRRQRTRGDLNPNEKEQSG